LNNMAVQKQFRDIKFDFDDISLIPEILSNIGSRDNINVQYMDKLPLFIAPMDTVVDNDNYKHFNDIGFNVCIPRNLKTKSNDDIFISYGLDEINNIITSCKQLPKKVLIDTANAHSSFVYGIAKFIKENYDVELMIGNIANPLTFKEYSKINVDYVRCGIGSGHVCTTSANSSIHYPMGSLINDCYKIKKKNKYKTKIVADGGFRNFDDINKALGLGADYVMLGNIINKAIESCGDSFIIKNNKYIKISNADAIKHYNDGNVIYKQYRGMSTKEVQKKWGKKKLRTAEGISKYNKVEYSILTWKENFIAYLRSCMSYQNKLNLYEFIGKSKYIFITNKSYNRFHK